MARPKNQPKRVEVELELVAPDGRKYTAFDRTERTNLLARGYHPASIKDKELPPPPAGGDGSPN